MPDTRKRPKATPTVTSKTEVSERVTLIVRRGAQRRFDRLARDTKDLSATVLWDRRQAERNGSPETAGEERREPDRRKAPPFTWEAADFVVVTAPLEDDEELKEEK